MLNITYDRYRKGDRKSWASLCAEDRDATLVEAARVFLGGDLEVHREDEVCAGEVQVDGQGHLRGKAEGFAADPGDGRTAGLLPGRG